MRRYRVPMIVAVVWGLGFQLVASELNTEDSTGVVREKTDLCTDTALTEALLRAESLGTASSSMVAGSEARSQVQPRIQRTARFRRSVTASRFVGWLHRHAFRLVLSVGAVAVIWAAFNYFSSRREQSRFLTTTRLSIMDKEVQRACRLVESSYSDPGLTPQTLCARLVTGESFLEALFQRELGMGIADFIEHVRINRVRQLLRSDPLLPVTQLVSATGFSNPEQLSRAFEQITGVTIERYRTTLHGEEEPSA